MEFVFRDYQNNTLYTYNTTINATYINLTLQGTTRVITFKDDIGQTEQYEYAKPNNVPVGENFYGFRMLLTSEGQLYIPVSNNTNTFTYIGTPVYVNNFLVDEYYETPPTITSITICDRLGNVLANKEFTTTFNSNTLTYAYNEGLLVLGDYGVYVDSITWQSQNVPEDSVFKGLSFNMGSSVADISLTEFSDWNYIELAGNVTLYEVFSEPAITTTFNIYDSQGNVVATLNSIKQVSALKVSAVGNTKILEAVDVVGNNINVSWDSTPSIPNDIFRGLGFDNYSNNVEFVVGDPMRSYPNLIGNIPLYEKYEHNETDKFTVKLYKNSAEHIRVDKTNFLEFVDDISRIAVARYGFPTL